MIGAVGVFSAGEAPAARWDEARTGTCTPKPGGTVRHGRISPPGVLPHRVATISVHTSPLEQPGGGDAGGMNVYILETARRLAASGVEVEIFTRATSSELPRVVEVEPGVIVRHVTAGPFEGLSKQDLPGQLCAFTAAVLRAEAQHEPRVSNVAPLPDRTTRQGVSRS